MGPNRWFKRWPPEKKCQLDVVTGGGEGRYDWQVTAACRGWRWGRRKCGGESITLKKIMNTNPKVGNISFIYRTGSHLCHLTHWGRATHICVSILNIIISDNGLSPGRRQAIIWAIVGILLIGHLETNFSEILIRIESFSFKKMHLKMSSSNWRPFVSASIC